HARRIGEARLRGCAVFESPIESGQRDRGIEAVQPADAMVARVGEIDINLRAVHRDAGKSVESGVRRIGRSGRAVAANCSDRAAWLPVSATKSLPRLSTATPRGLLNRAFSPVPLTKPAPPSPA